MLKEIFTIEEVAEAAGISRNAAYMHYKRGNLKAKECKAHRLYFMRPDVEQFINDFYPVKK